MAGMTNGAALRGGPPPQEGMSGSGALRGAAGPPDEEGQVDNMMEGHLQPIFEAAEMAGMKIDPRQALESPEAMSQVLSAAAKSDFGATDMGVQQIIQAAEMMGLPSPFRRGAAEMPGATPGPSGRPRPLPRQHEDTAPPDYAGSAPSEVERYGQDYQRRYRQR